MSEADWDSFAPVRRRDRSRPLISVVVPVYNEQDCLPTLYERLTKTLERLGEDYEIVFIDDGSSDDSLHVLRELTKTDPAVGFTSFSRNFGHEAATTCGIARACGQTVVLIDADLQDPPELIPEMLRRWREGADVVYAQRRARHGESWFTRWTSHAFYRIFERLAATPTPVDTGDFRLMDRAVVDAFARLPERKRFVRGLISWLGFTQVAVYYDREPRLAGATKYDVWNRLALAFDAFCGMSVRPLRWVAGFGLLLLLGVALSMSIVLARLLFWGISADGAALLANALFAVAGVQLAGLGLVGEYVGRIYIEVQGRPLYLAAETVAASTARLHDRAAVA